MSQWYHVDREDYRSDFPGRSTVDWMKPGSYTTREYAPSDSSDIPSTAFRRNGMSFDRQTGPQPRDYQHYDVHSRSGGGSGGDRLRVDAERMRSGGGSGYDSYGGSSSFGSRRESSARSHVSSSSRCSHRSGSTFGGLFRSSSSRRPRSPSPSPRRYDGPYDIGPRSSRDRWERDMPSYSGRGYAPDRERWGDRAPSYSGRGYSGYEDRGSSSGGGGGEYTTRIITPGGGGGDYESSRGSRSRRDRGRFEID